MELKKIRIQMRELLQGKKRENEPDKARVNPSMVFYLVLHLPFKKYDYLYEPFF